MTFVLHSPEHPGTVPGVRFKVAAVYPRLRRPSVLAKIHWEHLGVLIVSACLWAGLIVGGMAAWHALLA